MCFHSNQHPWAIKHPFISLYFKYQSLKFICLSVVNSPVFPSLDDIYCKYFHDICDPPLGSGLLLLSSRQQWGYDLSVWT